MKYKECGKCKIKYPLTSDYFHKQSKNKNGFRGSCKTCRALKSKEYYSLNKEAVNIRNRDYRKKNRPALLEKQKEYNAGYRADFPDKVRESNRKYYRKRVKKDPSFKLKKRVSKYVWRALKKSGESKDGNSVWKHLPYSPTDLKEHIESLMKDSMTWDNHGVLWEIDHVVPQAALSYDSMSDPFFFKCWELNNLRPIFKNKNASKSSLFMGRMFRHDGPNIDKEIKIKPWGAELWWAKTENYAGKILYITNGNRLSLQLHNVKEETIFVIDGEMMFVYGTDENCLKEKILKKGDSFFISKGLIHRMIGITDCTIAEVSTPELDDVVRLKDDYGREGT